MEGRQGNDYEHGGEGFGVGTEGLERETSWAWFSALKQA